MSIPQQSEVARLLTRIQEEYEAGVRGLTGVTYGMSQHMFVTQRMENMGRLHKQLQEYVGQDAIALISDVLENSQDVVG